MHCASKEVVMAGLKAALASVNPTVPDAVSIFNFDSKSIPQFNNVGLQVLSLWSSQQQDASAYFRRLNHQSRVV
jgi:hypothetical protein